jgi:hypothetical protein
MKGNAENDIVFLTLDLVLNLHRRSLSEHGGSDGTRDQEGSGERDQSAEKRLLIRSR